MHTFSIMKNLSALCLIIFTSDIAAFQPVSNVRVAPSIRSLSTTKIWSSNNNKDDATIEEEGRLKVWESRRMQIRTSLKSAESIRNLRLRNGWIPELDDEGNPVKSDGKSAVTITAFVVAAGAIALRIGGRAALVSAVGLDFLTTNPELQDQMNQVLSYADSIDPFVRLAAFSLAWTCVKVLCFDAGGVVLALVSGIIFGGVLQGAVVSAFGATVGSSVAFALAKLDTPVREKALELLEDNPSLKGIEKVVAEDGLKAILTLRLAPILPIPLGLYNYVYGVTNVPYFDFAGGIFLGSLKPYLLDSYLGYFGKEVVDGTAGNGGDLQDILLLAALGLSVLIGVFASQLAGETWDAVLKAEEEAEAQRKLDAGESIGNDEDDGLTREIAGIKLPKFLVNFQMALRDADLRINTLILQEFDAKVWNYTDSNGDSPVPRELDPAFAPTSPEIIDAYKGVDLGALTCDGLVLSPAIFSAVFKCADPLFNEDEFRSSTCEYIKEMKRLSALSENPTRKNSFDTIYDESRIDSIGASPTLDRGELLSRIQTLRNNIKTRIIEIDKLIDS